MSEPDPSRIMENNKRFREANEQINARANELGAEVERIPFLCECPVPECVEVIRLTSAEYAEVRADPTHYMTAPGHEEAEQPVGEVVSRRDSYVIVAKPL